MIGPNCVLAAANHPVLPELREKVSTRCHKPRVPLRTKHSDTKRTLPPLGKRLQRLFGIRGRMICQTKRLPTNPNLPNWSIRFAEGRAERFFECSPLPETHRKKVQRCRQEKFDVSKMVTSLCFSESFFECRSLHHRRREQRRWSRNEWYHRWQTL